MCDIAVDAIVFSSVEIFNNEQNFMLQKGWYLGFRKSPDSYLE